MWLGLYYLGMCNNSGSSMYFFNCFSFTLQSKAFTNAVPQCFKT